MLHLHIRDAQGKHSLDVQGYRDALHAVKAAVGNEMVLQITSEAARVYEAPAQIAMVQALHPEAVTVALREIDHPEVGETGMTQFFNWLARERVMTQVILYDLADLQHWQDLCALGIVPEAPWFLMFVLGRHSAKHMSRPLDIVPFVQAHTGSEPWSICAFGSMEHACTTAAAALGGHTRVGFENNQLLKNGKTAPNNEALVQQMVQAASILGRPLATAQDIRQRFSIA